MIFDYAIFGGGVVGCAVLNKLTRLGKKVVLFERELDIGVGQTKANSGLIHAGYDAKPGTLKAKLNVRGNFLYEKLANELKLPFKRVGAIVVSKEFPVIKELFERGKQNQVEKLFILKDDEIYKLVPNLKKDYHFALYAKTAGIISPFMTAIALAEEAVLNGAKVIFNFKTIKIQTKNQIYEISNGKEKYSAKQIINCAGAGYNEIAKLLRTENYELGFRRGEYYVLDTTAGDFVPMTVFPAPSAFGKGILATPTIDGNILFGPTSNDSDNDVKTTLEGLIKIKENISAMFENVPWNKIIRVFSGVRISHGEDFVIERSKKDSNVVNIAGINSPGLTAAPAIAEMVCELLNLDITKEIKMKRRNSYQCIKELSINELNQLIKEKPDFGKIVCRCETVSEREIKNAINSPLKPRTIDAIKRRVRAGMGRCQSGFCLLRVAQIISKECGIKLEDVLKEGEKSNLMIGDIFK